MPSKVITSSGPSDQISGNSSVTTVSITSSNWDQRMALKYTMWWYREIQLSNDPLRGYLDTFKIPKVP